MRACVTDGLDDGGFGAEKIDESREGHPERLPAGSDSAHGSRANARTGKLPNPRILGGTALNRAPVGDTNPPICEVLDDADAAGQELGVRQHPASAVEGVLGPLQPEQGQ